MCYNDGLNGHITDWRDLIKPCMLSVFPQQFLVGTSFVFINLMIILFVVLKHTNNHSLCSDVIKIGCGQPESSQHWVTLEADTDREWGSNVFVCFVFHLECGPESKAVCYNICVILLQFGKFSSGLLALCSGTFLLLMVSCCSRFVQRVPRRPFYMSLTISLFGLEM